MSARFVAGRPVRVGRDLFVPRREIAALIDTLRKGQACTVLGPARLGKTSALLLAQAELEREGRRVGYVKLPERDRERDVSDAEHAKTIVQQLASELQVPEPPPGELRARLTGVLAAALAGPKPLVLLIDEVNFLGPQLAGDVLGTLLELSERAGGRLGVALAGMCRPSDLGPAAATAVTRLPNVDLRDLDPAGMRAALEQSELQGTIDIPVLADRLGEWTGGHPYLFQRLCEAIARGEREGSVDQRVHAAAQNLLGRSRTQKPNDADALFAFMRDQMEQLHAPPAQRAQALSLYRRLLDGELPVVDARDAAQRDAGELLWFVGLARRAAIEGDASRLRLELRGKFIQEAFDRRWLDREEALLKRPYRDVSREWLGSGRAPRHLLRGDALARARQWLVENEATLEEQAFLDASELAARTRRHRAVLLAAAVTVIVALVAVAGVSVVSAEREQRIRDLEAQLAPEAPRDDVRGVEDQLAVLRNAIGQVTEPQEREAFEAHISRIESELRLFVHEADARAQTMHDQAVDGGMRALATRTAERDQARDAVDGGAQQLARMRRELDAGVQALARVIREREDALDGGAQARGALATRTREREDALDGGAQALAALATRTRERDDALDGGAQALAALATRTRERDDALDAGAQSLAALATRTRERDDARDAGAQAHAALATCTGELDDARAALRACERRCPSDSTTPTSPPPHDTSPSQEPPG
ncbi:High-affnity carbon uptake protein Hat/HatR [Sandaracinus amylolyticus]|uniref:High-affnity carbon uptake protein Hat/HatR n=2 Tax=Sandaracinus amylolyticus TaxID=927083 RepID=A0A0F6SHC5_9BACT|nr:High-affnity carbon uptake protein Hat/HatR [Sandaracinus amylolyticus]